MTVPAPRHSSRLTAARRAADLAALGSDVVDVLVVGGGVTGAGVALDAATRGLSVALVEKNDLAAGTSRWSSKLAHGGLRYIVAGQVGVAWESAVERNHLVRTIAPHLVTPMRFVVPDLPDYPKGNRALARAGFTVADVLRVAARTPRSLPRTRWVSAAQARALVPSLRSDLAGAFVTVDGSLEDDARLVVAIARTAASYGARIVTHCRALEVHRDGARVRDELTGGECDVRARCVVVATGVWSGKLVAGVPLQPSKGAHLLVRADALGHPTSAFNILVPGSRNRFVFAVPRPDGTVQVGVTDDRVDDIEDEPSVSEAEEAFLLETLSSGLATPIAGDAVTGRFAGLRPLLASADSKGAGATSAADLSRRHALLDRDGVLVLVGGKLTTYRRMAQDAVDRVVERLGRDVGCVTTRVPLVGAGPRAGNGSPRLARRFGSEAAEVAASGSLDPLVADAATLRCEVDWAIDAEGAVTADDVDRRLRFDLVRSWSAAARSYVDDAFESRRP